MDTIEILTFYTNFNKSRLSNWEFRTTTWLAESCIEGRNLRTRVRQYNRKKLDVLNFWNSNLPREFPWMSTVVSVGSFKVELDFLITAAKVANLRLLNTFFISLLLSLMARVGFFYETEWLIWLRPSISSHSKPRTRLFMRHLNCFVLNTLCSDQNIWDTSCDALYNASSLNE